MKTVNSLSGGKTSSYLSVHYPADYELFSLVCIEYPPAAPKDKKLIQMVNDRLQKYCPHQPEFIATAEDDKILKVMFDLEQMTGREIIWLRGDSFDEVIRKKKAIPNQMKRFCTTEMKMKVIFEFWLKYIGEICSMRVGYRWDEMERANRFSEEFKYSASCNNYGQKRNNWKTVKWREGDFVLINDKVSHYTVYDFWKDKGIDFPDDSNCQMCFWKPEQQLRMNWQNSPEKMAWAAIKEDEMKRRFKKDHSMMEIAQMGLQMDFFFGTGSGCQAGFCTD